MGIQAITTACDDDYLLAKLLLCPDRMTLFQSEFFLLAVIGGGFGVAYHDKLHVSSAIGGVLGTGAGVMAASVIALSVTVGFMLLTDKFGLKPEPADKD